MTWSPSLDWNFFQTSFARSLWHRQEQTDKAHRRKTLDLELLDLMPWNFPTCPGTHMFLGKEEHGVTRENGNDGEDLLPKKGKKGRGLGNAAKAVIFTSTWFLGKEYSHISLIWTLLI